MKLTVLAAIALLATLVSQQKFMVYGDQLLKDFREVLAAAEKLESSESLLVKKTDQVERKRNNLIYLFARIAKGGICDKQFEKIISVADEFRIKAHNFVDENKTQQNWITNLLKMGGSQGAMRNLARFDPYLNSITDRYAAQVKNQQVTSEDIDCDVNKFQIRNLHSILFVLQTDIKYMIIEDETVINRAIFEQLKADRFISSSNFYEFHELNAHQKELLLNFYADRVNHEEKTVGQALDHYNNPSEYIVGRIIESCQASLKFESELNGLEMVFNRVCSKSNSGSDSNKLFSTQYKFDKFSNTFVFCHAFLDAL